MAPRGKEPHEQEAVGGQAGDRQRGHRRAAPGTGTTGQAFRARVAHEAEPGSEIPGVRVGHEGDVRPSRSVQDPLALPALVVLEERRRRRRIPCAWRRRAVRRVSSQAMSATSRRTRTARRVMSSRLPIGVATT